MRASHVPINGYRIKAFTLQFVNLSDMKNYATAIIFLLSIMDTFAQSDQVLLFVGTYTKTCDSKGVYVYTFNPETADLDLAASTENVVSPSFLTVSGDGKHVYSVNENDDDSTVSAFAFDGKGIRLLNQTDSNGASPCYITDDERNVLVANYSGGTIAVFGKTPDGKLSKAKQVIRHHGSGPNRERQEKAHVHMVTFSPDGKYVLANDLGTDEISIYDYRPAHDSEILSLRKKIKVKPGSGPRHLTFSPNGKFAYLLHELDGTLTVFRYADGSLDKIQEATIVQNDFKGKNGAADIHITDDGEFVYATNRGDADTISTFAVAADGKLLHIETIPTKGKSPRNFAIAPGGKYLLVGHQDSNEIVVFSRDERTGKLSDTGKRIALCAPVCLKFIF